MGTQVNTQNSNDFKYIKAVKEYQKIIMKKMFSFIGHMNFIYKYTPSYKRLRQLLVSLHGFTNSVIRKRREKLNQVAKSEDGCFKKKDAFLDLLLQIKDEPLSDEDIREEVDTFMFEVRRF